MSEVSGLELRRTGAESVVLSWEAGSASEWWVWEDGVLAGRVSVPEWRATVHAGASSVWQVFDSGDDVGDYAQSGHVWLGWHAVAGAARYRVEEWVTDAWETRQMVVSRGEAYHVHRTRFLEDSVDHVFRVVPIGANGVDGDAMDYVVRMARHPDVPVVVTSWVAGVDEEPGVFSVGAG